MRFLQWAKRPIWFIWHGTAEVLVLLIVVPALWVAYASVKWIVVLFRWARRRCYALLYEPPRTLLSPKEIEKRRTAREERDAVRPLPAMRPRALTLGTKIETPQTGPSLFPGEKKWKGKKKWCAVEDLKQSTTDQLKISDFWKFPFEIRESIWKYAVGRNHIHIVRGKRRLCNIYCPLADPMDMERAHLCTLSKDPQGIYVPTAWPRDVQPLSLLLSCRQVYSETVDFLYSENTFSFDDLSAMDAFFTNLLPHRRDLINSVHIAFSRFHTLPRKFRLPDPIGSSNEKTNSWETVCFAALEQLRKLPKLELLTLTRPLASVLMGMRFSANPSDEARYYAHDLFRGLKSVRVANGLKIMWYMDSGMTRPEIPNSQWVMIPKRQTVELLAFFNPVHIQCLHCTPYTIIRKGTKGYALTSLTTLNGEYIEGGNASNEPKATHYWTFHAYCGGWIEFQFDWVEERWRVGQGAVEISDEEAESHLAKHGDMYPKMLSPHEALQGLQTKKHPASLIWPLRTSDCIDLPTKATFYRHQGWAKTRTLSEPWDAV